MIVDCKVVAVDKQEYYRLKCINHRTRTPFLKLGPCFVWLGNLRIAGDPGIEMDICLGMGFFQ